MNTKAKVNISKFLQHSKHSHSFSQHTNEDQKSFQKQVLKTNTQNKNHILENKNKSTNQTSIPLDITNLLGTQNKQVIQNVCKMIQIYTKLQNKGS